MANNTFISSGRYRASLITGFFSAAIFLALGVPLALPDDEPTMERLARFSSIGPHGRPALRELERAKREFPLSDERVRRFLEDVVAHPTLPGHQMGLSVVLYAHGAQGFLWALNQLSQSDDAWVRENLLWALRYHEYRETCVLYISVLDDERLRPLHPDLFKNQQEAPPLSSLKEPLYQLALYAFGTNLALSNQLPREVWPGGRWTTLAPNARLLLKKWWEREGERMITATRPSVVEILLKEAGEKAKGEGRKPALSKVEGAEQGKEPAPKAKEPDQKPKGP